MTNLDIARGSAWLVVALFVVSLVLEIRRVSPASIRLVWTFGVLALAAHVAWTMSAVHHGSLREAYLHTAKQTKDLIGIPIGEGVYVNFTMLAVWLGDAIVWWIVPKWESSRRKYKLALYWSFGFLFFNAAIVFASSWGRMLGLAACAVVVGAWLMSSRQTPNQKPA
jgi:hypothetical protein